MLEAEAEGSQLCDLPGLHSETLSLRTENDQKFNGRALAYAGGLGSVPRTECRYYLGMEVFPRLLLPSPMWSGYIPKHPNICMTLLIF